MAVDVKSYRRVIPVLPSLPAADLEVLRWLTRESFEVTAAAEGLVVVEWSESEVPAADIPESNGEYLARPITEYVWREFTAVARRPDPVPVDPVCGYCPHPPHRAGECTEPGPQWCLTDEEPDDCPCAVDVAALFAG